MLAHPVLLAILGCAWILASGRLLLSFLPPGWPGWSPGMGTRELGATLGASWLVGTLFLGLYTSCAVSAAGLLSPDPDAYVHPALPLGYLALHAPVALVAYWRSPAKLRPRHEHAAPPRAWWVNALATAVVVVAAVPAGLAATQDVAPEWATPHWIHGFWHVAEVNAVLMPAACAFLIAGALRRAGTTDAVAWLTTAGVIATLYASTSMELDPFSSSVVSPGPSFVAALALGAALSVTADRRCLWLATIALCMSAVTTGYLPLALLALAAIAVMVPGHRALRPAWLAVLACGAFGLVVDTLVGLQMFEQDGIGARVAVVLPDVDWSAIVPPARDPFLLAYAALAAVVFVRWPGAARRAAALPDAGATARVRRALALFTVGVPFALLAGGAAESVMFVRLDDGSAFFQWRSPTAALWMPSGLVFLHAVGAPLVLLVGLCLAPRTPRRVVATASPAA